MRQLAAATALEFGDNLRQAGFRPRSILQKMELSMDLFVAEAVLEFGDDLRQASEAAAKWVGEECTAAAA